MSLKYEYEKNTRIAAAERVFFLFAGRYPKPQDTTLPPDNFHHVLFRLSCTHSDFCKAARGNILPVATLDYHFRAAVVYHCFGSLRCCGDWAGAI